MKVLYYSEDVPGAPTGFGNQGGFLVEHWVRSGYDVTCITPARQGQPQISRVLGALVLPGNLADLANFVDILCLGANDKIVVLTETWILQEFRQALAPILSRIIVIAVIDGHPIAPRDRSLWGSIGQVVTISRFAHQELPDSAYIPHGVDTQFFTPMSPAERQKMRGWVATTEDDFVVGFIGSNLLMKGFHVAVKAVGLLSQQHPDVKMLLKGNMGDPEREWIKMCGVKTIAWNSELLPDLRHFYNVMNVNILPSQGEAFSLTTAESMCCGIPNVVTDYSGCAELVKGHGKLVPAHHWRPCACCNLPRAYVKAEALTIRLMDIYLMSAEEREALGQKARRAMQQYSRKNVLSAWDALFKSL